MLEAALESLPFALVDYVGMQRDEETAAAFTYDKTLPPIANAWNGRVC
jgi:uracil phosphoribosyltransferase